MLHAQIQFERLLKRRYLQQIAKIQRKKNYQTTSEMERDQFVVLKILTILTAG